jgi:hypothetical protein
MEWGGANLPDRRVYGNDRAPDGRAAMHNLTGVGRPSTVGTPVSPPVHFDSTGRTSLQERPCRIVQVIALFCHGQRSRTWGVPVGDRPARYLCCTYATPDQSAQPQSVSTLALRSPVQHSAIALFGKAIVMPIPTCPGWACDLLPRGDAPAYRPQWESRFRKFRRPSSAAVPRQARSGSGRRDPAGSVGAHPASWPLAREEV